MEPDGLAEMIQREGSAFLVEAVHTRHPAQKMAVAAFGAFALRV